MKTKAFSFRTTTTVLQTFVQFVPIILKITGSSWNIIIKYNTISLKSLPERWLNINSILHFLPFFNAIVYLFVSLKTLHNYIRLIKHNVKESKETKFLFYRNIFLFYLVLVFLSIFGL